MSDSMKDKFLKEHKGVELNDDDLENVSGGFTGYPEDPNPGSNAGSNAGSSLCPNNHTMCTEANCMNPQCTHLVIDSSAVVTNVCSCGKSVEGIFLIFGTIKH